MSDFYEPDKPRDEVITAFENGEKGITRRPSQGRTEYQAAPADEVEVEPELIQAFLYLTGEVKRLTDAASAVKELIKKTLGDHEYATIHGTPVIRWAHVKSRRLDMNELRSRVDPAVLTECYVEEVSRRFMPLYSKTTP